LELIITSTYNRMFKIKIWGEAWSVGDSACFVDIGETMQIT